MKWFADELEDTSTSDHAGTVREVANAMETLKLERWCTVEIKDYTYPSIYNLILLTS